MIKFVKSAETKDQYLNTNKPEVCLIGRSNVGKSSVINALAHQKIAKTSSSPGRTQLVNYFDANDFYLIDLPGYGYAKLNKQQQAKIMNVIQDYFKYAKNIKVILHLCDANVIMEQDIEIAKYLQSLSKHYLLVLNKVDKEKNYRYQQKLNQYLDLFNINEEQLIFVSAKTNYQISLLLSKIKALVKE